MNKNLLALCLSACLLLALAGCGPSPEEQAAMTATVQTATAASWTLTPTNTSTPTFTPTPTYTPTFTPTPSATPTNTPTSTSTPTATPDLKLYIASDGSFSFVKPEGWESKEMGLKYLVLVGPISEGFAPNLVFVEEASPFGAAFYSAQVQDNLKERYKDLKSISEDFLITDKGKDYVRWVCEYKEPTTGKQVHQILYFFDVKNQVLTAVFSRLKGTGAELDELVDAAMKTMQ